MAENQNGRATQSGSQDGSQQRSSGTGTPYGGSQDRQGSSSTQGRSDTTVEDTEERDETSQDGDSMDEKSQNGSDTKRKEGQSGNQNPK